MGRHAKPVSGRSRWARAGTLLLVWLGGLGAGFFALLSVGARYTGCSASARGLACRPAGTAVGTMIVIGVIATVTTATVLTHGRELRRILSLGAVGVVVLGAWYLAAHALLDTA